MRDRSPNPPRLIRLQRTTAVDIANGLPSFATVGLPHGAVKEGRERVNAAIVNTGFDFPLKRITG